MVWRIKSQWPALLAIAAILAIGIDAADTIGQTIYGVPAPVFRQNQLTGDATAQQNITVPAPLSFVVSPGASASFPAGTVSTGSLTAQANGTLLGNSSGGSAPPSPQNVGGGLQLPNGGPVGIAANGVTNAMLAQGAAKTLKGNNTGSTANEADLTVSQVNVMTGNYNGATLSGTPSNPIGSSSTIAFTMQGVGSTCAITPAISTRVLVTFDGVGVNTTAGDGASAEVQFGTGAAPANGAALTGTTVGNVVTVTSGSANQTVGFSLTRVITGLTPGTQIWLDLALEAHTGGTANLQFLTCTLTEQ